MIYREISGIMINIHYDRFALYWSSIVLENGYNSYREIIYLYSTLLFSFSNNGFFGDNSFLLNAINGSSYSEHDDEMFIFWLWIDRIRGINMVCSSDTMYRVKVSWCRTVPYHDGKWLLYHSVFGNTSLCFFSNVFGWLATYFHNFAHLYDYSTRLSCISARHSIWYALRNDDTLYKLLCNCFFHATRSIVHGYIYHRVSMNGT